MPRRRKVKRDGSATKGDERRPADSGSPESDETQDSVVKTDARADWSNETYNPYVIEKKRYPLMVASVLMIAWLGFLVYVVVNL